MKAIAIIVLLPLLSVAVVSLYAMGGAPRWAGVGLLVVSIIGAAIAFSKGKIRAQKED